MTTCKICGAPVSAPRKVYCSDDCKGAALRAYMRAYMRAHYASDPDYARKKNEDSRRWHAAHPDYQRERRLRKAYAAVLGKEQS